MNIKTKGKQHKEELAAMLMILKGWTKEEALSEIDKAFAGINP